MRRLISLILSLVLLIGALNAQSVGLVLSGGGAKGITHIGIIQALEENDIPIDYITGTSIGAIIGGLYAMGYTPQEMLELIESKEFKQCYSGEVDKDNTYYIKQNEPTPELYSIRATWDESKAEVQALPISLIDPVHMNIKILELCIQATAACKENFDSLFVPFRCVAADVYNKKEIIFAQGDLGNSVRASMTFPLVFRPIKINGVLAYDGGIYNNFPANVMKSDFAPDYIIGSVVSTNRGQAAADNIAAQVETLIMQASNYELPDTNGILMSFDLDNEVGLLDFDKAQYLFDLGYTTTLQLIDSIKRNIPRSVPLAEVNKRREAYKQTLPEVIFKNITISGSTDKQRQYIMNEIRPAGHRYVRFKDFKRAYFRLMSENAIKEIFPTATYNPKTKTYDLHLEVDMKDNFALAFGGGLSTNSINQIYYGLNYNHIGRHSTEILLDGQFGRMYNNIQLMGRVNLSAKIPTSLRVIGAHSTLNHFKQSFLFSEDNATPALSKQTESFSKVKLALPFMTQHKAEFGIGYGKLTDSYIQNSAIDLNSPAYDTNIYHLLGGSVLFKRNSLNTPQYATKGVSQQILAQIFTGNNTYVPDTLVRGETLEEDISWLQLNIKDQRYLPINDRFILGTYAEGYYSSRNLAQNYTATMLQAGTFAPTPSMLFTYNPTFRANQYLAAGVKPIYMLAPYLQLRFEAYAFVPLYPIIPTETGKAQYGKPLSTLSHIEELSVVGRFSTFVVSAYLNHNSSAPREVSIGISLGWYMQNNRFIEQ
ncbi:MAG: patatin-like phospholipase family protein [Bacteroidaceae bacterium]|nr:patatin-like phospholipase family protein [Bacteroidaceae bacterium]